MAAKKDDKPSSTVTTEEPKASAGEQTQTPQAPDYEERFKSFERTISEQGQQLKEMGEFVNGASTVINTIASDPDLTTAFKKRFAEQSGLQTQQSQQSQSQNQGYQSTQQPNSEVTQQVTELRTERRDEIIRQFEKDYGINSLPEADQKQARQKIANYLGDFGWEVAKLPVTSLRSSLDKAYLGSIGYEKLKEEGKLEGFVQARENAYGTFGSFPGGSPMSGDQTPKLTDAQIKWANKLKVDTEGAEKVYNERDREAEREKPVKE